MLLKATYLEIKGKPEALVKGNSLITNKQKKRVENPRLNKTK